MRRTLWACLCVLGACGGPATHDEDIESEVSVEGAVEGDEKSDSRTPALVLPLLSDGNKALSDFNSQLRAKGLKTFPTLLRVTANNVAKFEEYADYWENTAAPALNSSHYFKSGGVPSDYSGTSNGKRVRT